MLLDDGSAPAMTDVDEIAFRLEEAYRQHVRPLSLVGGGAGFVRRPCLPDDTVRRVSPAGAVALSSPR